MMPNRDTPYTSAKHLVATHRDWSAHPERTMKVDWMTTWTYADFIAWFRECLNAKISRNDPRLAWRKWQTDYQTDLRCDADRIRDFYQKRIRSSGTNLLRTPELQRRYPEINTCHPDC